MQQTPKQFWIRDQHANFGKDIQGAQYVAFDHSLIEAKENTVFHVIEYWAYNQLVYELDKSREQRDLALKERDELKNKVQKE